MNSELISSRYVEKMANIIILVETYHIMAYRIGYNKARCLQSLSDMVEEPIK